MGLVRKISDLFPNWFPGAKHNHYADFSWPADVTFELAYQMYRRNGLASSGVNRTILKTWQTNPEIYESEEPAESSLESDIRQKFEDLTFWRECAEADRRSIVGGYAGLIFRFADNKRFNEPVDRVPGGLDGLVDVIPVWAGQLTVSAWDTDERSENYGQPTMYQFNEAQIVSVGVNDSRRRSFAVHPDRIIIWSADGTVNAPSNLEPGYNALLDAEKVSGASGESFWKVARSALALEMDSDASAADMARSMGVSEEQLAEAINKNVDDFNKGFDKSLLLQGMTAQNLATALPSPEYFFNVAVQIFAASMTIPQKILVGNQTGERASTEDQRDWNLINTARRNNIAIPIIREILFRLESFGIIPENDWTIFWQPLLDGTPEEKLNQSLKMVDANQKSSSDPLGNGGEIFTVDEIRETSGRKPLGEIEEGDA